MALGAFRSGFRSTRKTGSDAIDPTVTLILDRKLLTTFAEGYRHLAYVQAQGGATMPQGLIEPQSEAEKHLYEDGGRWLGR